MSDYQITTLSSLPSYLPLLLTAVFAGKLWVIGGMPLNNEVWSTTNVTHWQQSHQPPPFGARSAFGITVQPRWIRSNITDSRMRFFEYEENKPDYKELVKYDGNVSSFMDGTYTQFDTLYLSGGWDGAPRNDIWATTDGEEWIELTSNAIWERRGEAFQAIGHHASTSCPFAARYDHHYTCLFALLHVFIKAGTAWSLFQRNQCLMPSLQEFGYLVCISFRSIMHRSGRCYLVL
jgi:hypothetical protein